MTVNTRKTHLRKLVRKLRSQAPKYRAARPAVTAAESIDLFMMSICHRGVRSDGGDETISVTISHDKNQTDVESVTHTARDPVHSCCLEAELRERVYSLYENSRQPFTLMMMMKLRTKWKYFNEQ